MRLSTNAQVCSHRFNNAYITRYAVGKEVRKVPTFNFKDNKDEIKIITIAGTNPNTKRMGARI